VSTFRLEGLCRLRIVTQQVEGIAWILNIVDSLRHKIADLNRLLQLLLL
jgi:hypothetical protein